MPTSIEMSPGAVAEALGVPHTHALAAIQAAQANGQLLDERSRRRVWLTHADLVVVRQYLPTAPVMDEQLQAAAAITPAADEEDGTPEPVSAEDAADIEQQLQRRPRRRK